MTITIRLPSGERRAITRDRILIGRGARCPICLPEAGHLQEEHARLRKIADRWFVESRGEWLIRVGDAPPSRYGWLKPGDVIRLSRVGPDLVFEPAHEDVVLAGWESPEEAENWHPMPSPSPARGESPRPIPPSPPPASRPAAPPGGPAAARPEPPLPAVPATRSTPPPAPGQASPGRPQPPPPPSRDPATRRAPASPSTERDDEAEDPDEPVPVASEDDDPDEVGEEPGDGETEWAELDRHAMVGTWVFGSLLLAFFVYVFVAGPDRLPEFKQRMLGISCGLLAGFFTYFLTGEITLRLPALEGTIGEKSRATGGAGVFVLVLLWWSSPLAPIGLAEAVDSIRTDTVAIRSDTREIKQGVGELGRLGGLIKDPRTPADYYHNARVHELGGQFAEAFADYENYVSSNQTFVDPFDSYLRLLRAQQGNEAALERFGAIRRRFPDNPAIEFVELRLLSGSRRLGALERFARSHADFGPAPLDIADHFSGSRMPGRSSVDSEKEREALRDFVRAAEGGKFARFYIDKNLAARLLDEARGRLVSQESPGIGLVANVKVFLNDGGIWVMDPTIASISFSFDEAVWRPTAPLVRTLIMAGGAIPDQRYGDASHRLVYAKYKDQKDQESRVFALRFEDDMTRAYRAKQAPPIVAPPPPRIPTPPGMPGVSRP